MNEASPQAESPTKFMSKPLAWGGLIVLVLGAGALYLMNAVGSQPPSAQALGPDIVRIPLAEFTLTERSGAAFSLSDLRGEVWIADFVFTSCAGPCPMMSSHMQRLQDDLADVGHLKLVSFSVDPTRDTPEVLRAYADRYGADAQRWLFLTGSMDLIYDLAIDGFKITVEEARENNQIIHDTRFVLVDAEGAIRGYYDSTSGPELQRLRNDARALARE